MKTRETLGGDSGLPSMTETEGTDGVTPLHTTTLGGNAEPQYAIGQQLGASGDGKATAEVTGGTGVTRLGTPFGADPLVSLVSAVNVTLRVESIEVRGLDTVGGVELFRVLSAHTFGSAASASRLEARAGIALRSGVLRPQQSSPVYNKRLVKTL